MFSTPSVTMLPMLSTPCLTTPKKNTDRCSVMLPRRRMPSRSTMVRLMTSTMRKTLVTTPLPLTGDPRVLLPVSRTRAHAVPAGLSPLLVPWKVPTTRKLANLFLYPNSNLLTATPRATVATVVTKAAHSAMLSLTPWKLNPLTHTRVRMVLANTILPRARLRSLTTAESHLSPPLLSRVLFPMAPSLLLLRLTNLSSRTTAPVLFALDAELASITLFSLSATALRTVRDTTLSRTLGEPDGAQAATSKSVSPMVLAAAVSNFRVTLSPLTEPITLSKLTVSIYL
mmetsp:Transcript_2102/g.2579  ORF Transcript_2102/g.2579 Transcript_2102/m.2579 type:complete len:285 (+) Transcript_2102:205-1059(+)